MMISRVMPAIVRLINEGQRLDKHTVAEAVHCDQRTAQRYLTHLHVEHVVRVVGWTRSAGGPIPTYIQHDGKQDAPRPVAMTKTEATRERRKDPVVREKENAKRRWERHLNKSLSGAVRLGVWGL